MYVDIKFPHWIPDFRRAADGLALASSSRRLGLLAIAQYFHRDASDFSLMFDIGKLHVYARGPSEPINCAPSDELLAICTEYAFDLDGESMLTRFRRGLGRYS